MLVVDALCWQLSKVGPMGQQLHLLLAVVLVCIYSLVLALTDMA